MSEFGDFADINAAYVHVPFCRHRCGYCNFTLIAGRDDLEPKYLEALERELSQLGQPCPVDTLFVGGGTPTHLSPMRLERLLALLHQWLPISRGGEFSMEANPVDLSDETLDRLVQAGVNRLSIGVQSFQPSVLNILERDHQRATCLDCIQRANAVLPTVSLDLIFAAPGESLAQWQDDLHTAIESGVEHISTYGLTFEKGAAFWGRRERGTLTEVDEELEREMYLEAIRTLTSAGFDHYEVSNFARPDRRCRHNMNYWRGGEYLAFGPGASRHVRGRRETNHRSTTSYIRSVLAGDSPVAEREQLTHQERAHERLVFALRMRDGLDRDWFHAETGYTVEEIAGEAIAQHVEAGRLLDNGANLRLSESGLLVSDSILVDLL